LFQKKKFIQALAKRSPENIPPHQVLTTPELATLWHLPSELTKIPNISWGRQVLTEAPENLPAAVRLTEEQKQEINFFAKTEFKK